MSKRYRDFHSSLQEYGNNASFHGLHFVTDPLSNKPRRLFWLLLLLACLAVLIYQIVDRVIYFYSYPVTVNVKVNYNRSLEFPAVTICNQNAYKATLSASLGRYRLIEKMYSESFNRTDLQQFSAENISLGDLFLQSSHRRNDFIFRRIWKGQVVDEEDIHKMATDHGVCYTFKNYGLDDFVTSPGVENGLRLTLNIEQYEYMPGPHDAAGIKMLLHDRNEIPRVHALGQAIPPGAHVFVGVKIVEVSNLPPPHGTCQDKTLEYVDVYTTEACQLDCLTKRAATVCGCRSLFMPEKEDEFPTISEKLCDCPVPCQFRLYETDISYASTSAYSLNKFLNDNDKKNLSQSVLEGAEVTSRYEETQFSKVQYLYNRLINDMITVQKRVLVNLKQIVNEALVGANKRYQEIKDHYIWKEYLYRYQAYILQKNFMRPRDAYEERTFHIVALGYAEYIMTIESRIRELSNENFTDRATRQLWYQDTSDMLTNRERIIEIALINFTSLIEAYDTGIQIFNYRFFSTPRSHNIPAAPKLLIKESRVHNSYARKYGKRFGSYLERTITILKFCQEVLDEAYFNMTMDEANMTECREKFRYLMRNWVFARSVFYFDTIDWPLRQIEERQQRFDEQWNELKTVFENLNQSLTSLKTDIQVFERDTFTSIEHIRDSIEAYLNDTLTKLHISEIFTAVSFQHLVTKLDLFFQQIRSREKSLYDWLSQMQNDAYGILRVIVSDEDSWEYYNFTGRTDYLGNISDIGSNLIENYTSVAETMQFSVCVNGSDSILLSTLHDFVDEMTSYKESLKIDSSFIKDNFLQVDIFYRQMSYEEIHQQEAYDMFSLWCDIGGTMGLFLGASFLSVVEIVDFILTHTTYQKKGNKDKVVRKQFL
ncbi:uncharacterized protein LOC134256016 [Saccostrea cucullata]|uniref:uncharacterized protein LOC134256016 n=1 Tax=Saccostrea cuccullata TaxID=36930 RepID=UPI002ED5228D